MDAMISPVAHVNVAYLVSRYRVRIKEFPSLLTSPDEEIESSLVGVERLM